MANEPEHRMLFDVRGRRKRVIQVIYVILAVIMAASLIVIGLPGNLNPFSGAGNSGNTDVAKVNVERADDIQAKFEAQPNNKNLAVALIRARFSAGQALYSTDPDTQQTSITDEATTQFDMAAETWNKYLKLSKDNPDPTVAQLMANMLFTLSQGSTVAQFQNNIKDAAKAQEFVAEDAVKTQEKGGASASNQLTTLAIYQLYAQDYAAAEKTLDRALAATDDKNDEKQIKQTFKSTKKDAQRVGKLIDKAVKQAQKSGDDSLKNPLGSLGTGDSLTGASGSTATP
ncbi:MAG: hypothetical protein J0H66_08080 [Solirubrobacterales bacterium]|nr:hypothetical protein [Solirubrobacterales bacterium]OJU95949.1 MAG: hypothetical protein BGO23_10290 [Solirubrobacterales bacterium 67-14]